MRFLFYILLLGACITWGCKPTSNPLAVEIYQTSAAGDKLTKIEPAAASEKTSLIKIFPEKTFQSITGFGGAFTESSAYLLNQLDSTQRDAVIQAYFGSEGAAYSLTRTHINSCDFSLANYAYAPTPGDTLLESFSIEEDMDDIIPMIKDAQKASQDGFHIIASPWTAPPWMKDNNDWKAGKLLPAYYPSWANYFVKYLEAYKEQGIDIWGITVENEPLGNGGQWESMHFTPEEMATFIENHLGPLLAEKAPELKVLVYDQNRDEMEEWAEVLLENPEVAQYVYGTAVHWYSHTADWLPEALNATHEIAPDKAILHTEACIDAEVPHWQEDEWYWKKEATDWGWDWAPEDKKKDHPKYVPVYRYARDIIGCMNSWVEGWVDWNMVLDRKGGPNWANNWCNAPVIVDPEANEVYYTPLYYVMSHFSKYIRPGATRIGIEQEDESLMVTAAQNPDGTIAVVVLNMDDSNRALSLELNEKRTHLTVASKAIQTIIIK